ncbi:MAG: tRNA-dihydrouridine synthase [Candidatus Portnoybacteria bacterium CG10_big_fil_rev_8_21_14_0_10_36_7]|uniref:tRNA-dihydrouridine synthase n=1 Tax=Candidatus Portnoybacteria bacterium CG10_big_fil_rev_8_21_14_0_10_36_7 TaxID=1974812 RepID=A0A2M8KEY2_9BACT|nr:MAG: tRNA-dihydrouridine synthase [Candidatus Portnoybacteria bacterium CG10_big_fil_rev_8_21_14_0_10_36_7]
MKNFWSKLKKPIFCLAPMADVTDCVFRQIIAKYGKPDVFWTEFVSADGLAHPVAREKLLINLKYGENEHPIVAQIFGGKPENIKSASKLCKELGFDGVDINMGCPDKSIEKQCAGAGMIKDLTLAMEVIQAAKEGAGSLPISVKTRIGYNKNEVDTWIRGLLEQDLAVLTVHLRTRKEMSDVPAHWEVMKDIIKMRNEMGKKTLIIGNGDVVDIDDAKVKCEEYGCDGVMLGRAIFGNPWLFTECQRASLTKNSMSKMPFDIVSLEEKLKVLVEHTKLFEKMLGRHKNFIIMKKHYKAYVNGFDGAKELRIKLMEAENATQIEKIVNEFLL